MRSGTYRYTPYKELLLTKGANKTPRVLSVPTARDRIALRALTDLLNEVFPETRSTIPHKRVGEVTTQVRSGRYDAFIKLDVKDFFPSVRHSLIERRLKTRIRKKEILDAIMRAVRTPTVPERDRKRNPNLVGVPQGLSVSNSLAELAVSNIDEGIAKVADCYYVRYVDDILILCDSADVETLKDAAISQFLAVGLKIHPPSRHSGKSSFGAIEEEFEYLGYKFRSTRVSIRKQSVRNIESSIARIFTRYKYERNMDSSIAASRLERRLNILITGCIYEGASLGWLSYFRQMNDLTLLKRLDLMIRTLIAKHQTPSTFRPKSFVRTYWCLKYPNGKDAAYIPNYDNASKDEMRQILVDYMGEEDASSISDRDLATVFKSLMNRITVDLERDIGHIS